MRGMTTAEQDGKGNNDSEGNGSRGGNENGNRDDNDNGRIPTPSPAMCVGAGGFLFIFHLISIVAPPPHDLCGGRGIFKF